MKNKNKYNMVKNNSSLCIGDLYYKEIGKNVEIKTSNGGKTHNKFNFVQLRMNHNCDYLFTAYYLDNSNINTLGELFIFRITKIDIKQLVLKYGSYAHFYISSNRNDIKWDFIKNNPHKSWDYNLVTNNPNITWEIVQNNPNIRWNYYFMSYKYLDFYFLY